MKLVKRLTGDFTVVNNKILRFKDISYKARGLYCFMLSLPENWTFSIKGLETFSEKDGRDSIASALKELEMYSLLQRNKYQDNKGFWRIDYIISDEILLNDGKATSLSSNSTDNPHIIKEYTENPIAGNPVTGNPTSDNTATYKELNNKELNNKINNLIKSFSEIDIKNSNYYQDFAVRTICKKLISSYGEELIYQAIQIIKLNNQNPQKYFPVISSPYELMDKWSKLKSFFNNKKQESIEKQEKVNKMLRSVG